MNVTISSLSKTILLILLAITACQSTEDLTDSVQPVEPELISPLEMMMDTSTVFNSNVTGFVLFDPAVDSTIYSMNGNKYFTPASNTKLFTFYAGLKVLPENLRALEYTISGD